MAAIVLPAFTRSLPADGERKEARQLESGNKNNKSNVIVSAAWQPHGSIAALYSMRLPRRPLTHFRLLLNDMVFMMVYEIRIIL
jgi:L-fucose isomerase-like protein